MSDIYLVSTNELSTRVNDNVSIVFITDDLQKAENQIGNFIRYRRDFPNDYMELCTALPIHLPREYIAFFSQGATWYSIVKVLDLEN